MSKSWAAYVSKKPPANPYGGSSMSSSDLERQSTSSGGVSGMI